MCSAASARTKGSSAMKFVIARSMSSACSCPSQSASSTSRQTWPPRALMGTPRVFPVAAAFFGVAFLAEAFFADDAFFGVAFLGETLFFDAAFFAVDLLADAFGAGRLD